MRKRGAIEHGPSYMLPQGGGQATVALCRVPRVENDLTICAHTGAAQESIGGGSVAHVMSNPDHRQHGNIEARFQSSLECDVLASRFSTEDSISRKAAS